jgi:drug/metabolite transporter (DMT)-like permease
MNRRESVAIACLLLGAFTWGVVWYPFRWLDGVGLSSATSTSGAYAVAVALGALCLPGAARQMWAQALPMTPIALFAGLANVGFLVAVTGTEVVRVVLLFYLAPVWTVPLAHALLGERMSGKGYAVIVVAMVGAVVMLWRPELGAPSPKNGFEWIGLGAGFCFAVTNVLVRRAQAASAEAKGLASCVGVLIVAVPATWVMQGPGASVAVHANLAPWAALALVLLGIVLLTTTVAMQHGLSQVPANRAAVILLTELIVAAVAAYLLAGEALRMADAIGGALIVTAGLVTAFEPVRESPLVKT